MLMGSEWLVDGAGCAADRLTSVPALQTLFSRIIGELDLHPLYEPLFHVFPSPGGITGFVILSESHLACHTYPEHGVITVNLYCCRVRPEWPWSERLAEIVGATSVSVRNFERAAMLEEAPAWR